MNGPNKPCECGSNRKQKKCHPFGAPLFGPAPEPRKGQPPVVSNQDPLVFLLPLVIMATMGTMRRF